MNNHASHPATRARPRRRRAFTFIDIMVTIAVMAIVVAVVLPGMSPGDGARVVGGARVLASDLEYAQSLSLSAPQDLAIVRFSKDGSSYWIARESDPETPVTMPGAAGGPYLVEFGVGRAALLEGATVSLAGAAGETICFDEFARLTTGDPVEITLTYNDLTSVITISPSTGAIKIQ